MLKMKKISTLIVIFITLLVFACIPSKVNASEITPFAYYDPNSVSFYGTYRGSSNYYDGTLMG